MKRIAQISALFLTVIAFIGFAAFLWLRSSLPQTTGTMPLAGLQNETEIIRDRFGVAHIFAKNEGDAFFALGVTHAQDRLWQMEMMRRATEGRLAEILGAKATPSDKFMRTLDLYGAAEASLTALPADARSAIERYTQGVNAYLTTRDRPLPPEFLLFGHTPEPWREADCLLWGKLISLQLASNRKRELARLRLLARLEPKQIREIMPLYPGDPEPHVPDLAALYQNIPFDFTGMQGAALPPDGAGSNNWVLSGDLTATGAPILANDPHMALTAPSIWYMAHMNAPGLEVVGFTLPGSPIVALGRNERIAWGATNTGPDVQDLYIEQIQPGNEGFYRTPNGWRRFETRDETVRVRDGEDVVFTVRRTRHGPVVSDTDPAIAGVTPDGYAMAMAWTGFSRADTSFAANYRMMKAKNWEDFKDALRLLVTPQQSLVYTDVDGNIGFYAPAEIPVRHTDNPVKGLAPGLGWDVRFDWVGIVPFEELPQAYNPNNGLLRTANQRVVPDDYPHFIASRWAPPLRADRITDLVETDKTAGRPHTLKRSEEMQLDIYSTMASALTPVFRDGAERSGAAPQDLLQRLSDWTGEMDADALEPLIYMAWHRKMGELIAADELGPLFKDFHAINPIFMMNVLTDFDDQSRWCDNVDTPELESCATLSAAAFTAAYEDLKARHGDNWLRWRWGDVHYAIHPHQIFNTVPVLKSLYTLKAPAGGGGYTLNVSYFDYSTPGRYDAVFGAGLRAIYDMKHPDRSLYMITTGQSGHVLSKHYRDMHNKWSHGRYIRISTDKEELLKLPKRQLTITPSIE